MTNLIIHSLTWGHVWVEVQEDGMWGVELGVKAGYLTGYQVREIKALGRSRTKHVPLNEVQAQWQALTFELQPLCVLEEVRESHLPLFGMFSPEGSVFKPAVLTGKEIMVDKTFVICCVFYTPFRRFLNSEGGLFCIPRGGRIMLWLCNES